MNQRRMLLHLIPRRNLWICWQTMFLFLLGLTGIAWTAANAEIRSFERDAALEILSNLQGPDKRVSVRSRLAGLSGALASVTISASRFSTPGLPFFTEPERSTRGVLHELRLDLRDFTLRGLRVQQLAATIPDCRFDYSLAVRERTFRLSRSGTGSGKVVLLGTDLEPFILTKYREIKRVNVNIGDGYVQVRGLGEFLVFSTEFDVRARLSIEDGTKLILSEAQITFDGRPADAFSSETLLRTLNPIVDLRKDLGLYDAITMESLELREGTLTALGRCRIPVRT